jgi:hypothetical protein
VVVASDSIDVVTVDRLTASTPPGVESEHAPRQGTVGALASTVVVTQIHRTQEQVG